MPHTKPASKAGATADGDPNDYLLPAHLAATRWLALPELFVGATASWQDVSLRPENSDRGFTVEICTYEVLEEDFDTPEGCVTAAGPHPRELLPSEAGAEAALDVGRMAVYLRRPFAPAEALAYAEALLVEAGVPVASLEEVDRDGFRPRRDGGGAR